MNFPLSTAFIVSLKCGYVVPSFSLISLLLLFLLRYMFLFLLDIFCIYIQFPFLISLPETPYPIPPPPASMRVWPHSPIPASNSHIPLHWGIKPSWDQEPLLPLMSHIYHPLLHMPLEPWVPPCVFLCWWFSPWELWGYWLINIVVPPYGTGMVTLGLVVLGFVRKQIEQAQSSKLLIHVFASTLAVRSLPSLSSCPHLLQDEQWYGSICQINPFLITLLGDVFSSQQ